MALLKPSEPAGATIFLFAELVPKFWIWAAWVANGAVSGAAKVRFNVLAP